MALSNRILAIDIGAASIKAAEFDFHQSRPVLYGYDQREYDEELTEESRQFLIAGLLRQMLVENKFQARKAVVGVSGQSALTRFVNLPPVADEEHRVRQIVEYEAQQNVPFSMDEVLWDYQLIGTNDEDELAVMFVVMKNEIVQHTTNAVSAVGLELQIVDVAPVACYNAARANHVGDDESAMVLNIGARSTNLLFADRDRFFCRTIPIAGHTITQQIAKEFQIGFGEAEELKRRHGFVALGGAYEEPESEVATAVSKIVRTVMTRLHGEINRSINVYRTQHNGERPETLFLTGGSSIMAYTDQFFAEKLRMNVSYLNPFGVVELSAGIDSAELQEKAHMFSEVIGLALRHRIQCPVEVSLVPRTIRRDQAFNKRKPYFAAALLIALLIPFVGWLVKLAKTNLYVSAYDKLKTQVQDLQHDSNEIKSQVEQKNRLVQEYRRAETLLEKRLAWSRILTEVESLCPQDVWLDAITPVSESDEDDDRSERRDTEPGRSGPGAFFVSGTPPARRSAPRFEGGGGALFSSILLRGNAIQTDSEADQSVEEKLESALRASPLFKDDPESTRIVSYESQEQYVNYSSFVIRAEFEEPLDLELPD